MIEINGGLVEPSPSDLKPAWAADTAEAALAMEAAEADYDRASDTFLRAHVTWDEAPKANPRAREQLEEVAQVLRCERDEVGETLRAARARYYQLAQRDAEAHQRKLSVENDRVVAAARAATRKNHRRSVLSRVGRG